MRVNRVPLYVCLVGLEHFAKNGKDARHGFVDSERRVIDFSGRAVGCPDCRSLMEDIDVCNIGFEDRSYGGGKRESPKIEGKEPL